MILGVIGAMSVEVQTLKDAMEDVYVTRIAEMEFYKGVLSGVRVVVVQCGVGKVNAAMCTQILCTAFGVTHIVNTGIAGALLAELEIGDMVVGVGAFQHDFDCTAFGYMRGEIPGLPMLFYADNKLAYYATRAVEQVHGRRLMQGCVASGDQFVSGTSSKATIRECGYSACVEMEGAAIAQVAFRNSVPFVIIRCISDKADSSAEIDYPMFEKKTAEKCAQVVIEFTKQLSAAMLGGAM